MLSSVLRQQLFRKQRNPYYLYRSHYYKLELHTVTVIRRYPGDHWKTWTKSCNTLGWNPNTKGNRHSDHCSCPSKLKHLTCPVHCKQSTLQQGQGSMETAFPFSPVIYGFILSILFSCGSDRQKDKYALENLAVGNTREWREYWVIFMQNTLRNFHGYRTADYAKGKLSNQAVPTTNTHNPNRGLWNQTPPEIPAFCFAKLKKLQRVSAATWLPTVPLGAGLWAQWEGNSHELCSCTSWQGGFYIFRYRLLECSSQELAKACPAPAEAHSPTATLCAPWRRIKAHVICALTERTAGWSSLALKQQLESGLPTVVAKILHRCSNAYRTDHSWNHFG